MKQEENGVTLDANIQDTNSTAGIGSADLFAAGDSTTAPHPRLHGEVQRLRVLLTE